MIDSFIAGITGFLGLVLSLGISFLPMAFIIREIKRRFIKPKIKNETVSFLISAHITALLLIAGYFMYIQTIPGTAIYGTLDEYGITLQGYIALAIVKIIYWNIISFTYAAIAAIFYFVYLFAAAGLDKKIKSEMFRDIVAFAVGTAAFSFIITIVPWIFIGLVNMLWLALS